MHVYIIRYVITSKQILLVLYLVSEIKAHVLVILYFKTMHVPCMCNYLIHTSMVDNKSNLLFFLIISHIYSNNNNNLLQIKYALNKDFFLFWLQLNEDLNYIWQRQEKEGNKTTLRIKKINKKYSRFVFFRWRKRKLGCACLVCENVSIFILYFHI